MYSPHGAPDKASFCKSQGKVATEPHTLHWQFPENNSLFLFQGSREHGVNPRPDSLTVETSTPTRALEASQDNPFGFGVSGLEVLGFRV